MMNKEDRAKAKEEIKQMVSEIMERENVTKMLNAVVINCKMQGCSEEFTITMCHSVLESAGAAATLGVIKARGWNENEFRLTQEEMEQRAGDMQANFQEWGYDKMQATFLRDQ
jgi:hypothetical protein